MYRKVYPGFAGEARPQARVETKRTPYATRKGRPHWKAALLPRIACDCAASLANCRSINCSEIHGSVVERCQEVQVDGVHHQLGGWLLEVGGADRPRVILGVLHTVQLPELSQRRLHQRDVPKP